MKKQFTILSLIFALMLASGVAVAQDTHYSNFHSSPMQLNPAFTGVFKGDLRGIAIYRNQWERATAKYNTVGVSVDGKISTKSGSAFTLGMKYHFDRAGDLKFTNHAGSLCAGALVKLSRKHNQYLSLGIEGGLLSYSADFTQLSVFDQEDFLLTAGRPTRVSFDVGTGMAWYGEVKDGYTLFAGVAAFHLNRPKVAMFSFDNSVDRLYIKYTAHAGGDLKLRGGIALLPSFTLQFQGPNREYAMGSFLRFDMNKVHRKKIFFLYAGAWARWYATTRYNSGFDALIFTGRLDYQNLAVSFSYDLNLSKLIPASAAQGGPEVSVVYTLDLPKPKRANNTIYCPRF